MLNFGRQDRCMKMAQALWSHVNDDEKPKPNRSASEKGLKSLLRKIYVRCHLRTWSIIIKLFKTIHGLAL